MHSDELLLRKLRHKSSLGAWGPWAFEVGEPVAKFNPNSDLMLESSNNVRNFTHSMRGGTGTGRVAAV